MAGAEAIAATPRACLPACQPPPASTKLCCCLLSTCPPAPAAVNQFGRQIKVIGNTGSNSTREAVHASEQGFAVGMDAALQINPYYGKTSMAGLREHFK